MIVPHHTYHDPMTHRTLFRHGLFRFFVSALVCLSLMPAFSPAQSLNAVDSDLLALGLFKTQWKVDQKVLLEDGRTFIRHDFEGAVQDADLPYLPVYEVRIPLEKDQRYTLNNYNAYPVEVEDQRYIEGIQDIRGDQFGDNKLYPAQPVQLSEVYIERKQRFQLLKIYPVQLHESGKTILQNDQLGFELQPIKVIESRRKTVKTQTTTASVLASGEWYKIGVPAEGMYRLDRAFLEELGVDVDNLDPRTIRLFGNGGGPVPQGNGEARYDDLAENPIVVQGEGDGSFDGGDYVMFYGYAPHPFEYVERLGRFVHDYNYYTDTVYYFLNVNQTNGKRVSALTPAAPGVPQDFGVRHTFINQDRQNLAGVGRVWFGDEFNTTLQRTYDLAVPNLRAGSQIGIRLKVVGRSSQPLESSFSLRENGLMIGSVVCPGTQTENYSARFARWGIGNFNHPANSVTDGVLNLQLSYGQVSGSIGWLDAIEVEYEAGLAPVGHFTSFKFPVDTNLESRRLQFSGMNGHEIWDVTDPHAIGALPDVGGNQYDVAADRSRNVIVFNRSGLQTPVAFGKIGNQNLHAQPQADYLIVTHPDFMPAAERLADFHRQRFGRVVTIARVDHVYNEFGAGRTDPSAIRDYVKMFYDRAASPEDAPEHLLFFGDASYDLKGVRFTRSFVPTFQSCESLDPTRAYASDDFFTFLDDNEGTWYESGFNCPNDARHGSNQVHYMDIAVGRLPANNLQQANTLVDKTIQYVSDLESRGDWLTETLFMSDIKFNPGGTECMHQRDNEEMLGHVTEMAPCLKFNRLHIDTYTGEQQAVGLRYPQAQADLLRYLNNGQLLVNYMGHGGEVGLSTYFLFEMDEIVGLRNTDRLAHWVTATCEFGRYDDPERRCGAEQLILNNRTGAVSIFTALRAVFVSGNKVITRDYLQSLFEQLPNGKYRTFGQAQAHGKNKNYNSFKINHRCFTLLGDPGIPLQLPEQDIVVTAINNNPIDTENPDTIKALSLVTITGEVRNPDGQIDNSFNGELFITVFDKPKDLPSKTCSQIFEDQSVRLFNGIVDVQNGAYEVQFVVPLDISYAVGKGRITMYANMGGTEAYGCTEDVIICCTDENANFDSEPPQVELMIDNENWIDGSYASNRPLLLALCSDDQGINTTGLGVGRDLTAVLNNQRDAPIILNNFYKTEKGSYNTGRIEFPMNELEPGFYTLDVKIWDVTNNSATDQTTFIVADDAKLALEGVLNFPNPFTESTTFRFNHNLAGQELIAEVLITDQSGRRVKHLRRDYIPTSAISDDITWDGTADNGQPITSGVYLYELRLRVKASGEEIGASNRLVYIRR